MRAIRIVLVGLGAAGVAYGVYGALTNVHADPKRHFIFLATVLIGHELLLMPLVLLAGFLLARYVPADARGSVQGALIVSAAVTFMALPLVLGYGREPDNPSALPLDYRTGLLAVLSFVWAVALGYILFRYRRQGDRRA